MYSRAVTRVMHASPLCVLDVCICHSLYLYIYNININTVYVHVDIVLWVALCITALLAADTTILYIHYYVYCVGTVAQ